MENNNFFIFFEPEDLAVLGPDLYNGTGDQLELNPIPLEPDLERRTSQQKNSEETKEPWDGKKISWKEDGTGKPKWGQGEEIRRDKNRDDDENLKTIRLRNHMWHLRFFSEINSSTCNFTRNHTSQTRFQKPTCPAKCHAF